MMAYKRKISETTAENFQSINRTVDDKLTGTQTEIDDLKKRVKALEDYVWAKKGQEDRNAGGAQQYLQGMGMVRV